MDLCSACESELPAGARFCASCGAPTAERPPPADERKLVTILFADLTGSTKSADGQDPERTRRVLTSFYDAMASEIERAGGSVEKFIGDAVMAAFGAPVAHEDDPERALHCALAMMQRFSTLFGDRLTMSIGVNTGEVVSGRSREQSSFVSGDMINVAYRLQEAAAPGQIVVGERTALAARGAFEFGELTTVEAKGKAGGVRCRRLLRAISLMRPRGIRGQPARFVGRGTELALLKATYAQAVEQAEPQFVSLLGASGIGKTRLVRELWGWLGAQNPQPLRRTGRCLPYGDAITYWPLGEILREHFGILESEPPEATRARLPDDVLGLALGVDVAGDLHPLAARERLHTATIEFFDGLTSDRATVILVEDLHWAEEPFLDLLELVRRESRGPLLLIGTARPELMDRRPTWSTGRRNSSVLWLEPLKPDDAARMLDLLIGSPVPDELRAVIAHAEGNPFFVEELLGTLIDAGAIQSTVTGWRVGALPQRFQIPDSVQGVLSARIDLLEPTEKAVLQVASVIGHLFWSKPVRELLRVGDPDWALLEDRDFIRRRLTSSLEGETEYAFKHALTRAVAYESLPKARRAELHGSFASWLEEYGNGRDEHASLLAHHYSTAVRSDDIDLAWAARPDRLDELRASALAWCKRAGELALSRYEIDAALDLFGRALALEQDPHERVALLWAIGRASALKYDGAAFWKAMNEAADGCNDPVVRGAISSELAFQTAARSGMWRPVPADELVQSAIDQALDLSPAGSPATVRALVARAFWRPRESRSEARQALELAAEREDVDLLSYALDASSLTSYAAGEYAEAYADGARRLELSARITDPDHLAHMRESGVPIRIAMGRFDEARRLAAEYVEIASDLTDHHRLHGIALVVEIEEAAGEWEAIRAREERVELAVTANLATPCVRNARSLLVCALARERLGDHARAIELEATAARLGPSALGARLALPKLQIALARGDLAKVEELLNEPVGAGASDTWLLAPWLAARVTALAALGDAPQVEHDAPALLIPGAYVEPFALRALGTVRRDAELLEQAAARFTRIGMTSFAREALEGSATPHL
jgi:class 3 adenylate cyclase/tetratricopeptide (TPR) repeat protein